MSHTFKDSIKHRRSYYALSNKSSIPDTDIEDIIRYAYKHVPSAFNLKSTRLVLLLGDEHRKLWNIAKETLKALIPQEAFIEIDKKISNSFASGYGTILFFEDNDVVEKLQKKFPLYKDSFPIWSNHTSAMHQFAIWTMLEDVGFGASLQHYNPLIDNEVRKTWNLPDSWTLIAQMPFGVPAQEPNEKTIDTSEDMVRVFK